MAPFITPVLETASMGKKDFFKGCDKRDDYVNKKLENLLRQLGDVILA